MQRMHPSFGLHRSRRRHESLTRNLSAEHSLLLRRRADAPKDVDLDGFEIEEGEECFHRSLSHVINLPHRERFVSESCRTERLSAGRVRA